MKRLPIVAAITLLLLAASPWAHADNSSFYTFWVGHFTHTSGNSLKWKDSTGYVSYGNGAQNAADAWSSATSQLTLTKTTTGANIEVHTGAFGDSECGHTTPSTTDSNGNWTATVHWYYDTVTMSGSTPTQRQQCGVHEFGHALGLDHEQKQLCTDVQMMDGHRSAGPPYADNDFWTCGYTVPRLGDSGGINALY